jgi:membrane peptidoglycan carboxypeptidase
VSTPGSSRAGLGGLGALFFLGSLGAIALYVQRQELPQSRALERSSATVVGSAQPEPEAPPALPWQDRLDLAAASLVPYGIPASAPGATPGGPTAAAATAAPPVDPAHARFVQELNDGHRILLSLDPVLQDAALQIFENREVPYAAAVMIDLRDSSVLVLAGHSTMDKNVEPLEVVATAWAPAASVFKLVTTVALLEGGKVTPESRVCFNGGLHGITDDELRDDPGRDTQCETLSTAVAQSYNLVLAKLALANLGQEQLLETAQDLLFERDIPFELNVERSPAHIPADAVERAKVAAGFWNVDMSPLHGAVLASVFARGGLYQPPHIISQVLGPDGSDLTPAPPKSTRVISREIADGVAAMMLATTTQGTARPSFRDDGGNDYIRGFAVAGKTGSLTGKRAPALNYNWFIGYAPAERPEIAFAVLLANEPKWRIKAHYAARRLLQLYLERRDAIARARDARLTLQGLTLPQRDASGSLVSAAPTPSPPVAAAVAPAAAPGAKARGETPPIDGAKEPTKRDAPVAAPAPTEPAQRDNDALPPVPGPLPQPPQVVSGTP